MAAQIDPDELERRKIGELYGILSDERTKYVLEDIDKMTIYHTPLHEAAGAGMTHLALEVANLKSSLARKLNHEGLSPVHLALKYGHLQTVRALVAFDPSLVRVKGKDLVTPLHYAAEIEEAEILAEFLSACPSSIEDLTSRCETAIHIAVGNKNISAFKVLFGWLRRVDLEEVLDWKDEDGNTVFHIAILTNQPEVMKLLIGYVKVNAKNFQGLTALDLYYRDGHRPRDVYEILHDAKAKRASEVLDSMTCVDYLSRVGLSSMEWRDKQLGLTKGHRRSNSANELRNIYLVVAVLIVTATYQGILSPPQRLVEYDFTNLNVTGTWFAAWKMVMKALYVFGFDFCSSAAFVASMATIVVILVGMPMSSMLTTSGAFILVTFFISVRSNMLPDGISSDITGLLVIFFGVIFYSVQSMSNLQRLKSQLDSPGRRIGGFM